MKLQLRQQTNRCISKSPQGVVASSKLCEMLEGCQDCALELNWVGWVCVPACHKPPFSGWPALSEAFICSCLASLLSNTTSTLHNRSQLDVALGWNWAARISTAASSAFQSLIIAQPLFCPAADLSYLCISWNSHNIQKNQTTKRNFSL